MPVTSQIGGIDRHCDHVTHTSLNAVSAAAADIPLGCLIGLHPAHFETRYWLKLAHLGSQPNNAHTTRPAATIAAAARST